MIFIETKLPGAFVVELKRLDDERGFFARSWCAEEFAAHGLNPRLAQCNVSFNKRAGTLRGLHFQRPPFEEAKLIRCTAGGIYAVMVDLRPTSPTRKQWVAAELSVENHRMLYIPEGFAAGFQTLFDNTEVFYQMTESFHPEAGGGVRWNDPAFAIEWPEADRTIAARDREYADFEP